MKTVRARIVRVRGAADADLPRPTPADGSVLHGPPPRPLPRILLEIRDGAIYAVGVARGDA